MYSDEISFDLLTNDFNSRSFLMSLRRENERFREIFVSQYDRQYPSKYCTFDKSRGFARMKDFQYLNINISSQLISKNGKIITDDLSKKLLDDNLFLVHHHWQRSKILFSNKMKDLQSDLNLRTNISLKKTMSNCRKEISNWIFKNRLK